MPTLSRSHARTCLLALGVLACVLTPARARAESPSERATLSLQPEAARVFLRVSPEWLLPSDRRLAPRDPRAMFLREWTPSWSCAAGSHAVRCTVAGPPIQLELEHRSRRIGFGVTVLPRAAVAVLRFDPVAPWIR